MKNNLLKIFSLAAMCSTPIFSEGFYLHEKSGTLGADTDDASILFYNPAGSKLKGRIQTAFNATSYYHVEAKHQDKGIRGPNGRPTGHTDGRSRVSGFAPSLYAHIQPKEGGLVGAGLSIAAPYGLSTNYEPYWNGRYEITNSKVESLNITPSLILHVHKNVRMGFGIQAEHFKGKFKQKIDTGSFAAQAGIGGALQQQQDSEVRIKGKSFKFAPSLGVSGDFNREQTQWGIAYKFPMNHKLKGNARFNLTPIGQTLSNASGQLKNTNITIPLKLPNILMGYMSHKWNLHHMTSAEVQWMGWSRRDVETLRYDNPQQPDLVIRHNYKNTWRWAMNHRYTLNQWSMGAGFGHAQTPTKNNYRKPDLPDTDRWMLNLNLGYKVGKWQLRAGWYHYLYRKGTINLSSTSTGTIKTRVQPKVSVANIHISTYF
jgi:long-chain fatty acid transport protein